MTEMWNEDRARTDALERDMEIATLLKAVDPASGDPHYWLRFRQWVVTSAALELSRRRLMSDITVGDVMSSWARAVLPTTVFAAALAGLILLRSAPAANAQQPVGVEELLVSDLDGASIRAVLSDGAEGSVSFASEIF